MSHLTPHTSHLTPDSPVSPDVVGLRADCQSQSTVRLDQTQHSDTPPVISRHEMKKRSCPGLFKTDNGRRLGDDNDVNKENNDNNNKPVLGSPPKLEWLQKTFLRSQSEYISGRQPARTLSVQVTDCNESNKIKSRLRSGGEIKLTRVMVVMVMPAATRTAP